MIVRNSMGEILNNVQIDLSIIILVHGWMAPKTPKMMSDLMTRSLMMTPTHDLVTPED